MSRQADAAPRGVASEGSHAGHLLSMEIRAKGAELKKIGCRKVSSSQSRLETQLPHDLTS